jgi:ABC transporter fused permease/ATP-binding protein
LHPQRALAQGAAVASSKPVSLRRILALAKPETPQLVLGTAFLLISSSANLVFPQGIRFILDKALSGKGTTEIDRVALLMLGVFLLQGVAGALRFVIFSRVGERIVARLRQQLFARLLDQEVAFFDGEKTGDLTNRLTADTTILQNTVSVNISQALRSLASVLGGMVLLLVTSPRLTLVMLLIVPPVALFAVRYARRVRGLSREVQDASALGTAVAEEALSSIRTVRAFAGERAEVKRFHAAVEATLLLAYRRIRLTSWFFGVVSFSGYGAGALVFWYGGRLVVANRLSTGELTSFLVYTMIVAFSLASLADLWADFSRASGASERVFELIDRKPQIAPTGGLQPLSTQGRVEWRDIEFHYPMRPDVPVLHGFSLTLALGEVVALVGASGAGKSTVSSLLYRLYDPQSGAVYLDDCNITELDPTWLREQIGVVSQEPLLFSTSIEENIRYGSPEATLAQVQAAAKLANADGFISAFPDAYSTLVGERGVQLSGGQKQRVAIARAVLKNPRVLILDEATSALDAESEAHVREALDRLMVGRTTLVIAHRLSSVKSAERVVVLEHGRIVQSGSHAELIKVEGLYRRLVERQFEVFSE